MRCVLHVRVVIKTNRTRLLAMADPGERPVGGQEVAWEFDIGGVSGGVSATGGPVFLPFARSVSKSVEAAHASNPNGSVVVRIGADDNEIDLHT